MTMPTDPSVKMFAMVVLSIFALIFLGTCIFAVYKEDKCQKKDNGWIPLAIFSAVVTFLLLVGVGNLAGIKLN